MYFKFLTCSTKRGDVRLINGLIFAQTNAPFPVIRTRVPVFSTRVSTNLSMQKPTRSFIFVRINL